MWSSRLAVVCSIPEAKCNRGINPTSTQNAQTHLLFLNCQTSQILCFDVTMPTATSNPFSMTLIWSPFQNGRIRRVKRVLYRVTRRTLILGSHQNITCRSSTSYYTHEREKIDMVRIYQDKFDVYTLGRAFSTGSRWVSRPFIGILDYMPTRRRN